ncbi:Catechol O-methyltransferase domain-containing protein 1 [Armadillidium nasatum]|uniref:Catechol O-methyltransferase domain-containing protein 1 n=1 Tax=Armadillidium nasatum TaxID=96803 RepID=A0A5N5TGH4_9CRUS|nr:Catechol O-methyltransferase domain-containing protein 1 [Armadillidium nasatum]
MPQLKCFKDDNALNKYVMEKSLRQTKAQKGLMEATLKHPDNIMLGDPIVLQLTANLIRTIKAKKVLDVGVYTGASALSAAIALPDDGKVFALDITDEYVKIGRPFWKEEGIEHKIDLILAPALETLDKFIANGESGTFDFAFIDADKPNYDNYYEKCLILIRSGGIIAIDNTIWHNSVVDGSIPYGMVEWANAIKELNDKLKDDQRINISYLTIGDGLTLCFKNCYTEC